MSGNTKSDVSFKFDILDMFPKSLNQVKEMLNIPDTLRLGDIKFVDLLLNDDGTKGMRHGVYLFFNEKSECVYVGKCSSGHFAQRLGAHFGMSPKCSMNQFLRGTVKRKNLEKEHDEYAAYVEAAKGVRDYRYVMIAVPGWNSIEAEFRANGGDVNIKNKNQFVQRLEDLFMAVYCSSEEFLNKPNARNNSDSNMIKLHESLATKCNSNFSTLI